MTQSLALDLVRQTLMTAFWLALPLLAIGFLSGVVISLVQIVTSFQDPSFGGALRLAAFVGGLLVTMPWMLTKIIQFTVQLFGDFSRYAS